MGNVMIRIKIIFSTTKQVYKCFKTIITEQQSHDETTIRTICRYLFMVIIMIANDNPFYELY